MALASRWKKTLVSTGSPSTEPGGGFRASPPPGRQPGLGSPTPNLRQPLNRLLESPRRKQPQVSKLRPLNPRHPTWWSQPKVPPPHSRKFLISSITFPSKHAWSWFVGSSTAHSNIPDLTEEELVEGLKKRGLCCRHQEWLTIWCDVEQDPGYSSPQLDAHKQPTEVRISSCGKSYIRYSLSWERTRQGRTGRHSNAKWLRKEVRERAQQRTGCNSNCALTKSLSLHACL